MSIALTINGTTYAYPETNDQKWGPDATQWAQAVTSGMLQKAGGLFQLLAEVDLGTTYGIKSVYFKSRTTNPADAGQIRLANADTIKFRNSGGGGNIAFGVGSTDAFASYAGVDLVNVSGVQTLTNKTFDATTLDSPILNTPSIVGNADSTGYYVDVLNVLHYGALGDGSHDDTVAIQAALDYAGSLGGATVYFPAGIYKTTAQLTWPDASNITLAGAGAGQSVLKFSWGASPSTLAFGIYLSSATSTQNSVIRDLVLQGSANSDSAIYDLIEVDNNVGGLSLLNCELKWARHAALNVPQNPKSNRLKVFNCYIHDINSTAMTGIPGAALENLMNQSEIIGNTFEDIGNHSSFHAVYFSGANNANCVIANNVFKGTNSNLQIFDNVNTNFSITGNTFQGCIVYLYDLVAGVFSGNSLSDAPMIAGSNNLLIESNYFYKTTNSGYAIQAGGNNTGIVLSGNFLYNTGTSNTAINIDASFTTASSWTFSDNFFLNFTKAISLYGTNHVVKDNRILSTDTSEQIFLRGGTGHSVLNNFIKGGSSGVAINNATGASQVVRGNNILNSGTITVGSGITGSYLERAGSASLPTYSFFDSPDTGSYSPSSANWAVSTSGTIALRINNSQQATFSALVTLPNLTSSTANAASAGTIRLAAADTIKFRNALNNGDLSFTVGSSDAVPSYGTIDLVNLSTSQTLTNKTISASSNTISNIANANVAAAAAIDFSKLATLSSANILVGNVSNVAASVAVTGDITITNAGVTAIGSGKIVNAQVNASAAIDFSKLAALTSGNILVGNVSNVAASVAMSSEATISNAGAVTLTNSAVIGKVLTGYTSGSGTVAATDTILQAVQKLNGNDGLKLNLAGGTLSGQLLISSGSSGSGSIAFSAETSLGIFRGSTGSVSLEGNQSGGVQYTISNLNTSGDVKMNIISAASGSGDAFINFRESSDGANTGWSIGRDDSDSASFVIGSKENGTLGTNNVIRMTTGGAVAFPQVTTTASAANAFLDSGSSPINNLLRSTSSKRYKKNIEDLTIDSEVVYQLRPVEFDDKTLGTHHFGLVAEEVAEICPLLVNYANETLLDPAGDPNKKVPDGVQYQLLSVLLLNELKKLKNEIEELKKAKA